MKPNPVITLTLAQFLLNKGVVRFNGADTLVLTHDGEPVVYCKEKIIMARDNALNHIILDVWLYLNNLADVRITLLGKQKLGKWYVLTPISPMDMIQLVFNLPPFMETTLDEG